MKRSHLLTLLEQYSSSPEQIETKKQMLAFIKENPNCFERSLESGHVTASSWLLNHDKTHALLMHHAKLNRWLQLGGHCDGNPDVLAVAIAEAREESGVNHIAPIKNDIFDIDIHLIPENSREKEHYHYDVRFLLQMTQDKTVIKNSESHELIWISKEFNMNTLVTDTSVLRLFSKWIQLGN